MSRQHHYLKIQPQYFNAILDGIKTFEIRFNDRGYKVGDILYLQEFCRTWRRAEPPKWRFIRHWK